MRGLLIRHPFVDMILAGEKIWEMRGARTSIREQIALIASGSGTIMGVCDLVDCIGPLTIEDYRRNARKAGTTPGKLDELPYPKTYAWVMAEPQILNRPVPYSHPQGAVIWVQLERAVEQSIRRKFRSTHL